MPILIDVEIYMCVCVCSECMYEGVLSWFASVSVYMHKLTSEGVVVYSSM